MVNDTERVAGPGGGGGTPRQLRPTDVKRLNREWRRRTEGRLALLLDSVSQPFNVGSIVRTAAAFGVECVWLCGNTPDLDLPAVGKTALGTDRFLSAYREPSPAAAAKDAAEDGFRVVAVELASGAVPLFEAPLEGDICLAIGNEDHGCSPALLAAVSSAAYIPQVGRVGSLNVAVAAAIALGEVRRREWQLSPGGTTPVPPLSERAGPIAKIASLSGPIARTSDPRAVDGLLFFCATG
jgi:tRNA G18 (ribose-2'-O)-methylase SpoU